MKRYFFGALAAAIALTLASFTIHSRTDDMFVFEYDPTASGGYASADVEDESNVNWKYIGKNLSLCSDNPTRACRVSVTGTYVDNTTTPTELSGVTITATESSTGVAYVTGITAQGTNIYSNKQ